VKTYFSCRELPIRKYQWIKVVCDFS
jgi:hypothetical protein